MSVYRAKIKVRELDDDEKMATGNKFEYADGPITVDVIFEYPDGRKHPRIRKIAPVQTLKAARQYEREIRNAIANGTYGEEEVKQYTIEEFSKEFLEVYAKNNNCNSTQMSKRNVLYNHIIPILGKKHLNDLTVRDAEHYRAEKLKQGLAQKTINNHLGVLGKMLNVAVEWKLIDVAPKMPRFKRIKKPQIDYLRFGELERLLAVVSEQTGNAIILAANTGLRLGEIRALQWDDVDLVANKMHVQRSISHGVIGLPKSGKEREIPLNDTAVRTLTRQKHLQGEFVFSQPDGKPLEINTMYRRLEFFCRKAGLRRIGFHTLRHTFASHLVMKGVPLRVVQELLGHSDIKMTLHYSHVSPNVQRDFVNLLDEPRQYSGSEVSEGNSKQSSKPHLRLVKS